MTTQDTSLGLLRDAQSGSDPAWQRLCKLYEPLLAGWARKHAATPEDAEDLAQEIRLKLFHYLRRFEHWGRTGSFRAWLRTIAAHTTHDFCVARRRHPRGSGDTDVWKMLEQLQDSSSGPAQAWDREHDLEILMRLLAQVSVEFEPPTMRAFRRQVLEGKSAETVAGELNMSLGAVYTAKSRVLRRLRGLSEGILDWGDDSQPSLR